MAESVAGKTGEVKVRAVRKHGWSKTKRAVFITVLSETCNVRLAAQAAGMSARGAHALRARDGAFAILWGNALQQGYDRLEHELLASALGTPAIDRNPDEAEMAGAPVPEVPFDAALALKVLQMRGGSRPGRGATVNTMMTQSEVDAQLLARLDALAAKRS